MGLKGEQGIKWGALGKVVKTRMSGVGRQAGVPPMRKSKTWLTIKLQLKGRDVGKKSKKEPPVALGKRTSLCGFLGGWETKWITSPREEKDMTGSVGCMARLRSKTDLRFTGFKVNERLE